MIAPTSSIAAAVRALLVALSLVFLCGGCASRGEGPSRVQLTLATATEGGGFESYGRAFAEVLTAADLGLEVLPRPTQGSTENIALIESGRVDLALVTGEVAHRAFSSAGGTGRGVRVLSVMYSLPGMFAVRADSSYRHIEDLKGKPVVFGARGSGLVVLARHVLEGLGLDMERDFQPILLERAGDGPAMVLDGRAAALWGGGADWPPFATLARTGVRFIVPDDVGIARIRKRHPHLGRIDLPAGSYPGQDELIPSVGSWSLILLRPDFDEALAWRVAGALHRGEGELARRLPRARETRAEVTAAAVPPMWLHAGVLRYLGAAGLGPTQ